MINDKMTIGVVGLGYVGLPLACLFAKRYKVLGFDTYKMRLNELSQGFDRTEELSAEDLSDALAGGLELTDCSSRLADCDVIVVAVPTPVKEDKTPDLEPLIGATKTVGGHLRSGTIVVYESTVAPGTTEEVCVPILERCSGLTFNQGFYVGFSPERVVPGDQLRKVSNITKIVSASTPEAARILNELYGSVLEGGTHLAPSIKVAEAAKILENTQRDVNIALINEVTRIFNAMSINVNDVLDAAGTKWNFHRYYPGLVGGHCIGVDPYYLLHKAEDLGVEPFVIKAARRENEFMAEYLSEKAFKALKEKGVDPQHANILLMGFAFKPDCPDVRNTKALDVYRALRRHTPTVTVYDPVVHPIEVQRECDGLTVISSLKALEEIGPFDAIVHCTPHTVFQTTCLKTVTHNQTIEVELVDNKPVNSNLKLKHLL